LKSLSGDFLFDIMHRFAEGIKAGAYDRSQRVMGAAATELTLV
jgi:hypothetical protein